MVDLHLCTPDSAQRYVQSRLLQTTQTLRQALICVLLSDHPPALQFYWGDYSYGGYVDAILHLTELQAQGVLKGVGLTNFDVRRTQQMLDAGAQLVSNQVGMGGRIQRSVLGPRGVPGFGGGCCSSGDAAWRTGDSGRQKHQYTHGTDAQTGRTDHMLW